MKKRLSRILGSECINGRNFPADSIRIDFENGCILVGCDFNRTKNGKTEVFLYKNEKWYIYFGVSDQYTREMWKFWKSFHNSKMLRRFNTRAAMNHDRRHKGGSGGVRLGKFCGQVTDYECAKEPLHDFRRVWN